MEHKNNKGRYAHALTIAIVSGLAVLPQAYGAPGSPIIEKAAFNVAQGKPVSLHIVGKNFGTIKPSVTIAGVTQSVANGYSDTVVDVIEPIIAAPYEGTYRVTVTNNSNGLTSPAYVELDVDISNFGVNTNTGHSANGATCTLGQIILSAGPAAMGIPANGQLVAISMEPVLFDLIGTTFGGDGVTTFKLPDLRAAAPNGLTYSICDLGVFPSQR